MEPTGCGNPDCECNESAAEQYEAQVDCVACDFADWAGDSLAISHSALIDALELDGAARVRAIVHALEHLEDVLDVLFPEDEAVASSDEAMKKTLGVDELRRWVAEDCAELLFGANKA